MMLSTRCCATFTPNSRERSAHRGFHEAGPGKRAAESGESRATRAEPDPVFRAVAELDRSASVQDRIHRPSHAEGLQGGRKGEAGRGNASNANRGEGADRRQYGVSY